jgi:hypothetical protein
MCPSRRFASRYVAPRRAVSRCLMSNTSRDFTPPHTTSRRLTSCNIKSCHVTPPFLVQGLADEAKNMQIVLKRHASLAELHEASPPIGLCEIWAWNMTRHAAAGTEGPLVRHVGHDVGDFGSQLHSSARPAPGEAAARTHVVSAPVAPASPVFERAFLLWTFSKGGCSGRGVQWMGVALCNKTVQTMI